MMPPQNTAHIAVKSAALGKWVVLHVGTAGPRQIGSFGNYRLAVAYARGTARRERLALVVAKSDSSFRPHAHD